MIFNRTRVGLISLCGGRISASSITVMPVNAARVDGGVNITTAPTGTTVITNEVEKQ